MLKSTDEIVFGDLIPILKDFTQEDIEKLRSIFDGTERRELYSITCNWKCPLCFITDQTIACVCSQNEIEQYKKKSHLCPRCFRRRGFEINMALIWSSK